MQATINEMLTESQNIRQISSALESERDVGQRLREAKEALEKKFGKRKQEKSQQNRAQMNVEMSRMHAHSKTIRDLIQYLRDDGEDYGARIECGRHNLIEQGLVPMVKCEDLSDDEFDIAIRLMVKLCQPAISIMRGKPPTNQDQRKMCWELEENLRRAKNAFTDAYFFVAIKKKIDAYFIDTDFDDLDERLRLVVKRIVLLIKYIFSTDPDTSEGRRTRIEDSNHDRVILAFLESGIDKTLMHIANHSREKEFHTTILDIFALILKEQSPETLSKQSEGESEISAAEKKKTEEDFMLKGISSNSNQVVFKPIQNVEKHNFLDERKAKERIARNRRPFEIDTNTHFASSEVRKKLKDMVIRLIETCFNRLMKSAKSTVFVQGNVIHKASQINYFFMVKFVLRFVRMGKMDALLERVSECTGMEAFHENNVQLTEYVKNAMTPKDVEAKSFGLKAQYALGAYNELVLLHIYVVEHGKDESEKKKARKALEHITNVEKYRELPISIIKKFSSTVLSNNFLRELVLTTHHYIKLVERFVKVGALKKVTKKVKIRKNQKKIVEENDQRSIFDEMLPEALDSLWEESKDTILQILNEEIPEIQGMKPIDSQLEGISEETQKKFAKLAIQRSLRARGFPAAVGLYHASRKIWDDGSFGTDSARSEGELEDLHKILKLDLKKVANTLRRAEAKIAENDSQFKMYISKFANVDVLKWYVFLLNDFSKNSIELNQALVKMLHRIAFDINLPVKLYQVSRFQIFQKVNEQFSHLSKELRKTSPLFELYQFGFHLLEKFFVKFAEMGADLAVEALFWKGPKECFEIDNGYGSYTEAREADIKVWTEELETELRNLYDEYKSVEGEGGVDVFDFIQHSLSRSRQRKQIAKKLIEFGLDLLGAEWKNTEGSRMDAVLPVGDIQKWHDEWKEAGSVEDVVDVLKEKLTESLGSEISRKKIIKQLAHMDILYEKPKKEKPLPEKQDESLEIHPKSLTLERGRMFRHLFVIPFRDLFLHYLDPKAKILICLLSSRFARLYFRCTCVDWEFDSNPDDDLIELLTETSEIYRISISVNLCRQYRSNSISGSDLSKSCDFKFSDFRKTLFNRMRNVFKEAKTRIFIGQGRLKHFTDLMMDPQKKTKFDTIFIRTCETDESCFQRFLEYFDADEIEISGSSSDKQLLAQYTASKITSEDELDDQNPILARHRKEKKELRAKMTAMKKAAKSGNKQKKKETNAECRKIRKEQEERHKQELAAEQAPPTDQKAPPIVPEKEGAPQEDVDDDEEGGVVNKFYKTLHISSKNVKRQAKKKEQAEKMKAAQAADKEKATIKMLLAKDHLRMVEISSDGDCLYNSLVHQWQEEGVETTVRKLRKACGQYMREHKDDVAPFIADTDVDKSAQATRSGRGIWRTGDEKWDKYLEGVEKPADEGGVMGGELELRAISRLYKKAILVYRAEGPQKTGAEFETAEDRPLRIVYLRLAYTLGEHYNSTELD
ncbi:hypothetical protein B9Z55_015520 [Caenorhabditis nigoni]|nr:hypothetical protein B9Z55_015520 [Caenorhabditis nigoni]